MFCDFVTCRAFLDYVIALIAHSVLSVPYILLTVLQSYFDISDLFYLLFDILVLLHIVLSSSLSYHCLRVQYIVSTYLRIKKSRLPQTENIPQHRFYRTSVSVSKSSSRSFHPLCLFYSCFDVLVTSTTFARYRASFPRFAP